MPSCGIVRLHRAGMVMSMLRRQSDKVDVLAQVPLFEGLSRKELTEISKRVTVVEFPPGELLMITGGEGREAFVILEGRATVRIKGRKVAELSQGDVVGEMSLITDLPRNASVRSDTFLPALRMVRADFTAILDEHPKVAVKVLKTVSARLVEAIKSF